MVVGRGIEVEGEVILDGDNLGRVDALKYLGTWATRGGNIVRIHITNSGF